MELKMRDRSGLRGPAALLALAVALVGLLIGCRATQDRLPYPHESVLSVLAELKIALRQDPYAEEPPQDLEGQNLYRATLARLDSLDRITEPVYDDILTYAKAECMERLGEWRSARDAFEAVSRMESALAPEAARRAEWAMRIEEIVTRSPDASDLHSFVESIDARLVRLAGLLQQNPPPPYESYIKIEMEQALREKATFLFNNRVVLAEGAAEGLRSARQLTEDHAESWRQGEHKLLLGGFLETLARDYARLNDPSRFQFDLERWKGWEEEARRLYFEVAQDDGDPFKPEAQARLRGLDAFALRVTQLAR